MVLVPDRLRLVQVQWVELDDGASIQRMQPEDRFQLQSTVLSCIVTQLTLSKKHDHFHSEFVLSDFICDEGIGSHPRESLSLPSVIGSAFPHALLRLEGMNGTVIQRRQPTGVELTD